MLWALLQAEVRFSAHCRRNNFHAVLQKKKAVFPLLFCFCCAGKLCQQFFAFGNNLGSQMGHLLRKADFEYVGKSFSKMFLHCLHSAATASWAKLGIL
jgi:hypothetical protein